MKSIYDYAYKITPCPLCLQGLVTIVKEIKTNHIFLYCDECLMEWNSPQDVLQGRFGFRFKYGRVTEPTLEEIKAKGWDIYLISE